MTSYDEILQNMKNAYFDECGENPDMQGDLGVRFKAVASELFNLAVKADYVMKQNNWRTATGEHLDALAQECDIQRRYATKSTGTLTFKLDEVRGSDLSIPKRTICSKAGERYIQYVTTSAVVIKAGATEARVSAEAMDVGMQYNAGVGQIDRIVNPPIGVSAVINETDFIGGWDDENDEALRDRIASSIKYPANGLNVNFVEQRICAVPHIASCNLVRDHSFIRAYVKIDTATLPSTAKAEIEDILSFVKLLGVSFYTNVATGKGVSATVTFSGDATVERVEQLAKEYITSLKVGDVGSSFAMEQWLCSDDGIRYCDVSFVPVSMGAGEYAVPENIEVLKIDSAG